MRIATVSFTTLLALSIALAPSHALRAQSPTFTITDSTLATGMKRLGINLGARNRWGDAQILKNLIDNPGFEAGHYASVVLADSGSTPTTFRQGLISSTAQPNGFWTGATYEIVWGAAKGRSGRITSFTQAGGRYTFGLDGTGPAPGPLDVMLVRRAVPGIAGNTTYADTTARRPESPGRQSLRMTGASARFDFYMDSYWRDGDRSAGKFLPVRGPWRAEVWAKGRNGGEGLRVQFLREGTAPFIDGRATLTAEWKLYSFEVNVPDGADPVRPYGAGEYRPILDFRVENGGAAEEIWVDDVALYRTDDTNRTIFSDAFVQRLQELKPGIVRDWSTQLGASLDAQLALPFARGTNASRSDGSAPGAYGYGLHDFLELAELLGAEPWYVVPPTLSREELAGLMEYLGGPADGAHPFADLRAARGRREPWTSAFTTIHLEYGNELWGSASAGDPFQGASVNGGVRLGAIGSDRLAIAKASPFYDAARFNTIIGGQAGYSGRQREIEANSTANDAVALAPYFGVLDTWADSAEILRPLLATPFYEIGPGGRMRQSKGFLDEGNRGTKLAIYEINFHTTSGNAPIDIRNDFLTGAPGGVALPLIMLTYQRELGAVDQCAFSALGYSFRLANNDYARVWGLLRDLYAGGRKRPTWLGLELANDAILPTSVAVGHTDDVPRWTQPAINGIGAATTADEIQCFAYRDGHRRSAVLFNLSLATAHTVELRLPADPKPAALVAVLGAPGLHANNEDTTLVTIERSIRTRFARSTNISLPPCSITSVQWEDADVAGVDRDEAAGCSLHVPTPCRHDALVRFTIGREGPVLLELIDMTGRTVARLADETMSAGEHTVGIAAAARPMPGCYLLRLRSGATVLTRSTVVIE